MRLKSPSLKVWIAIVTVILLALDGYLLETFRQAYPNETFSEQLVGYLGSNAFGIITVSAAIPLILALLNAQIGIGDAVRQRIQTQRQALRKNLEADIRGTTELWDGVYTLCGRIVSVREYGETKEVRQLASERAEFASKGIQTVTAWAMRFDNLRSEDLDVFADLFDTLLDSMDTVLLSIRMPHTSHDDEVRTRELQDCLRLVGDGITSALGHPMLSILSLASQDRLSRDLPEGERTDHSKEIKTKFDRVRRVSDAVLKLRAEHNQTLPYSGGPEVDKFRGIAGNFMTWSAKNPKEDVLKFEGWVDLHEAFNKIPDKQILLGTETSFAPDFVKAIARHFAWDSVLEAILEDAKTNNDAAEPTAATDSSQ